MEMQKSRVYVLTDEAGHIIQIEGEYSLSNIQNMAEWTLIEEGPPCDRLNHAQNMYLDGGLCTSDFIPRYKLIDGKPVLRTDEEIESDRKARPEPEPDATTLIQLAIAELAQVVEDNNTANQLAIAELAEAVIGGEGNG